jgi:hypothetical protein
MNLRHWPLIVVVAGAIGLSGCGIPYNSTAQVLPSQLLNGVPNVALPTSEPPSTGTNKPFLVYFLRDNVLTAVSRPDPSASRSASATDAIEALNNGPDLTDLENGVTNALASAPGAGISYVDFSDGVVTVNLNEEFTSSLIGVPLYQAFGQIVATLTSLAPRAIHAVSFLHDGITWPALLPDGQTVYRKVDLCDYASIASGKISASCVHPKSKKHVARVAS